VLCDDQHRETIRAAARDAARVPATHACAARREPASVAVSYQAMIDRVGWKKAQRQLGISLPGGRAPTLLELNAGFGGVPVVHAGWASSLELIISAKKDR
jgi:hypothetical protein